MTAPQVSDARAKSRELTAHQLNVLQALADGDTQVEIAAWLWVGRSAVANVLQAVRTKLRVSTNEQAIAEALRRKIIS